MTDLKMTAPVEAGGAEITRFNALKHGVLSRFTVLPWEDADEYGDIVGALVAEHAPQGPTEEHLVEELAGIFWRKRRLRLAEGAAYRNGLRHTLASYSQTAQAALSHLAVVNPSESVAEALRAGDIESQEEIADIAADEAMTHRALKLSSSRRNDAYEAALVALREDTQQWWAEELERDPDEFSEDEGIWTADAASLRSFIEDEVLPWLETRRGELERRPLIREQAFGEALEPGKFERLGRYEVHLDRKLERMLTMLLRLKELRLGTIPD